MYIQEMWDHTCMAIYRHHKDVQVIMRHRVLVAAASLLLLGHQPVAAIMLGEEGLHMCITSPSRPPKLDMGYLFSHNYLFSHGRRSRLGILSLLFPAAPRPAPSPFGDDCHINCPGVLCL